MDCPEFQLPGVQESFPFITPRRALRTSMGTGIGSRKHSGRKEVNNSQTSTDEINKD